MAYDPCDLCDERFVGSVISGYHRWFAGVSRRAWKQRMCPKCAKIHFGNDVANAVNTENDEATYPDRCYACDKPLEGEMEQTWTVWYRGKQKTSLTYITCAHCAGNLRTRMMVRATELEERPRDAVGSTSAPLPNPPGFGSPRVDLPW